MLHKLPRRPLPHPCRGMCAVLLNVHLGFWTRSLLDIHASVPAIHVDDTLAPYASCRTRMSQELYPPPVGGWPIWAALCGQGAWDHGCIPEAPRHDSKQCACEPRRASKAFNMFDLAKGALQVALWRPLSWWQSVLSGGAWSLTKHCKAHGDNTACLLRPLRFTIR